jgi:hypothetical protein
MPHTALAKTCEDYMAVNSNLGREGTTEGGPGYSNAPDLSNDSAVIEADIETTKATAMSATMQLTPLKPITPEAFRGAVCAVIERLQKI